MTQPVLLLDVDGPLIPILDPGSAPPPGYQLQDLDTVDGRRSLPINLAHGTHLNRLARQYDLMWATTWAEEANSAIGRALGLPELPVVDLDPFRFPAQAGLSWKTPSIAAHFAGRRIVWCDDDASPADAAYLNDHGVHAAVLRIDAEHGMQDSHFDLIAEIYRHSWVGYTRCFS